MVDSLLRRFVVLLTSLLIGGLLPVASNRVLAESAGQASRAEDEGSGRLQFEAGRSAYERGAFAEALGLFERAHALSHRPELLFNIARAAEADGRAERALSAYAAFLEAVPAAENRAFVEARMEKLRSGLGEGQRPEVPLPAVSSVAPVDSAVAPVDATPPPFLQVGSSSSDAASRADVDPARPFYKRAWFWSVVGGVVVAGIVGGAIAAATRSDRELAPADVYVVTPVSR